MIELIKRDKAINMIKQSEGKIFAVDFVKKDKTRRHMLCRRGVTSYLKGGELKYNPEEKALVVVFDMQKKDYRMINLETLFKMKMNHKTYFVF